MFDHLCLRRWPFVVVPEPSLCNFMADREQFRADLEKLLRSLSLRSIPFGRGSVRARLTPCTISRIERSKFTRKGRLI